jgi:hypothetical protein
MSVFHARSWQPSLTSVSSLPFGSAAAVILTLLQFPAFAELLIPALNWRTARVLGLPIPPPLNIAIRPNKFEVCPPEDRPLTAP